MLIYRHVAWCLAEGGRQWFDYSHAVWQHYSSLAFLLEGVQVKLSLAQSLPVAHLHPAPRANIQYISMPSLNHPEGVSWETFTPWYKLNMHIHTLSLTHTGTSKHTFTQWFILNMDVAFSFLFLLSLSLSVSHTPSQSNTMKYPTRYTRYTDTKHTQTHTWINTHKTLTPLLSHTHAHHSQPINQRLLWGRQALCCADTQSLCGRHAIAPQAMIENLMSMPGK